MFTPQARQRVEALLGALECVRVEFELGHEAPNYAQRLIGGNLRDLHLLGKLMEPRGLIGAAPCAFEQPSEAFVDRVLGFRKPVFGIARQLGPTLGIAQ